MICTDAKVSERKYVLCIFKFHQHRSETQTRVVSVGRVGCQRNSRLLFNSIFINNSRFRLSISTAQSRFSITTQLFSQSDSFLFYRLSISSLRTRSLGVRDRCHVHLPSSIRRKDRRDIDGSLDLSVLTLRWYTLYRRNCWKILVECRYNCRRISNRSNKSQNIYCKHTFSKKPSYSMSNY